MNRSQKHDRMAMAMAVVWDRPHDDSNPSLRASRPLPAARGEAVEINARIIPDPTGGRGMTPKNMPNGSQRTARS